MVVQFGLSQQQDITGLAGEVKPVLAPAVAVPQTAGHSWDKAGGISSATDGKADKTPLENTALSWVARVSYTAQELSCHCQAAWL